MKLLNIVSKNDLYVFAQEVFDLLGAKDIEIRESDNHPPEGYYFVAMSTNGNRIKISHDDTDEKGKNTYFLTVDDGEVDFVTSILIKNGFNIG